MKRIRYTMANSLEYRWLSRTSRGIGLKGGSSKLAFFLDPLSTLLDGHEEKRKEEREREGEREREREREKYLIYNTKN